MEKYLEMMTGIGAAANAINGEYLPSLRRLLTEHEVNGLIASRCQLAQSEAPQPLTVAVFTERDPYTNPDVIAQSLEQVMQAGYVTAVSPGAYQLTEKGQALADELLAITKKAGAQVEPLAADDMAQLVALLERAVAGIQASDAPQVCLHRSRFFDPGVDAPLAERARRYLNDLLAFRDDAHPAAWAEHDVVGPAWEAFSHVSAEYAFGEAAPTAAALAEKLSFRGYDADDYAAFLQPLVNRGWLTLTDDTYALTDAGRKLRAAVEAKTDANFYGHWPLTEKELADLQSLLSAVVTTLEAPSREAVWTAVQNGRQAIAMKYVPPLQKAGINNQHFAIIARAQSIDPEPVTAAHLRQIVPYISEELAQQQLVNVAEAGYLKSDSDDGYVLTGAGTAEYERVLGLIQGALTDVKPLPSTRLAGLADLVRTMSDAAAAAPQPAAKHSLSNSRTMLPEVDDPPLFRLSRTMLDLFNFRDDAHVASWRAHEAVGYVWEAFSHVWGENVWGDPVHTAVELAEKLGFRGYDGDDYAAALSSLVERGWLVEDNGRYEVTAEGQALRTAVERQTDQLFYAPWQLLAPSELRTLHEDLTQLTEAMQPEPT